MSDKEQGNENQQPVYNFPTFKFYLSKKKRLIFLLTLFFFVYYFSLPLLTSFFPAMMKYELFSGISFAWIFALSQIAMTWLIHFVYFKKSASLDIDVKKIKTEYEARRINR